MKKTYTLTADEIGKAIGDAVLAADGGNANAEVSFTITDLKPSNVSDPKWRLVATVDVTEAEPEADAPADVPLDDEPVLNQADLGLATEEQPGRVV